MVLSSQMARPGTTRSNMYARGGARRNRFVAILVGGAVLALAVWWFWPRSSEGSDRTGAAGADVGGPLTLGGAAPRNNTDGSNEAAALNRPDQREQAHRESERFASEPVLPEGRGVVFEPIESPSSDIESTEQPGGGTPPLTMGQSPANTTNEQDQAPVKEPARRAASPPPEPKSPQRETASPTRAPVSEIPAEVAALLERADREINANRLVEGRATLNAALAHPRIGLAAEQVRTRLAELNAMMVFGKTVVKGDPFATTHLVKSGDRLSLIARTHAVDERFLAHVNALPNPDKIFLGQSLKIIRGPFHAEIDKSDFRLDVYLGDAGSSSRTYVRSFFIGLGELGSTPTGLFRVRANGKVENPAWTNPRTGEHFKSRDPNNPIGKFWIGLEGADEKTRLLDGYGIHGTIEPRSIGRQMSMGCIRLYDDDITLLFGMLAPEKSTVMIRE